MTSAIRKHTVLNIQEKERKVLAIWLSTEKVML